MDFIPIVLAYLEWDGRVLLTRRPAGVPQGGRWEFPGGKVEAGEAFPAALKRELREEVGIAATVEEEIAVTRFRYPDYGVELHLFRVTLAAGEPTGGRVADARWVPVAELGAYEFPPANAALLAAVGRREGRERHPSCPEE